jgi:hypothetical protein
MKNGEDVSYKQHSYKRKYAKKKQKIMENEKTLNLIDDYKKL